MNDTQIAKWGNSLAVRIPRRIANRARLEEGDAITVDVARDGSIVLRPAVRKYELKDLVTRITKKNRHSELDWGPPVGREVW